MDVTRSNFLKVLPLIEEAVTDCDFVSIDEELSGLRKGRGGHMFDLQAERYRKMRDACMSYSIIQFGLTCFRQIEDSDDGRPTYEYHSFNIFIFPYKVTGLPRHLERNVEMQTSAVSFLRAHAFDFNTLFDEGISYLTLKEEADCEQAFRSNEERTSQQGTVVPDEMRDFVNECVDQVREFVKQDGDECQRLDLPVCTAFKRKLLYEALSGDSLRESISISTLPVAPASRDSFLSITRSSPEAKRQKQKDILTEAAGFSRILHIISKCKKPLVGHNLFLDIMHVVGQFLTDLPDTYEEFKEVVHDMFPHLYDTKYIASTLALKKLITSSTLEDLDQTLSKEPFKRVHIVPAFDATMDVQHRTSSNDKFHQAGYDSFITGHCFIRMNNYLQHLLAKGKPTAGGHVIGSEIQRYVNRLTLTYSFDLDHYYLGGSDIQPERAHVYHVSFPATWNTHSLVQLFAPFGSVQINWIDDTSAFVGLKDAGRARSLNKSLSGSSSISTDPGVQITPYYEFRSRVEAEVTSNCSKRSLDEDAVVRTGAELIDERKKERSVSQESGKRVRREGSAAKKPLQKPFPEEKDW